MTRIQTNVASLRGLRALNNSNKTLNTSLTRLTTGLKINSGKDNPAGLIAGETLRSQIAAIEQSITNSNRANNVIATADAALGEVSSLLTQVRGLIQEGVNDGALSQDEIDANQLQIDSALSAINRIGSNTSFGGDKILDGSKGFRTTSSDGLSDFTINEAVFADRSQVDIDAEVIKAAEKGELSVIGGSIGDTALEVAGAKGREVLFLGRQASADDLVTAVNAVTDATGVEAEVTAAGAIGTIDQDLTLNDGAGAATTETVTFQFDDVKAHGYEVTVTTAAGTETGVTGVVVDHDAKTVAIAVDADTSTDSTDTAQSILDAINDDDDASAWVKASITTGNEDLKLYDDSGTGAQAATGFGAAALVGSVASEVSLKTVGYGADEIVEISALDGRVYSEDDGGAAVTRDAGLDIVASINGQIARGDGLRASIKTSTLDASLTFADTTASNVAGNTESISTNGGGALFQIGQKVDSSGQIQLGIEAVNTARLGGVSGKLYELSSAGGKSLLDIDPSNNVSGADLVNIVEEAINEVSTLRGRLGALQKNVIETNVNSLGVALENISESRSAITDTDFAEETANLTRSQILSQAGYSALQIANQNPQSVLSLLG